MKTLTSTVLLLCLFAAPFYRTEAQQDNWVKVSDDAEYFHVSMPHQPKEESARTSYGALDVNGKRYEASADGAGYVLWALVNSRFNAQATDPDLYLDQCADLVWEALLKQARDNLPKDRRARAAMTYVKELPAKPLAGREYLVAIGDLTGTTQFYIAGSRIYVLLAVNSPAALWARERFLGSFKVSPNLPMPHAVDGDPIGAGIRGPGSEATDDNRVFRSSEVTQRARVLEKPEPAYTEGARKFSITGTVVLRAIFSRNGEVTNIHIIRKLPHGLTQQTLKAARGIRFTPAQKDGQPVSMWIQLEYNFNLY